jgi:hypothetical protein
MSYGVLLERVAARRAGLDLLEELVKRLADVRLERDELVVAERVVQRIGEHCFGEYASLAPAAPSLGGRRVCVADPDPCRRRRSRGAS